METLRQIQEEFFAALNDSTSDFAHYIDTFNWSGAGIIDEQLLLFFQQNQSHELYWPILNDTTTPSISVSDTGTSVPTSPTFWFLAKICIPLYSVIFLLGITGNVLVILTLVQNSRMRTVTNLFLLNLAIADLSLGVFCIPFTLVGTLLRDFIFGRVFCKLITFFQGVSVSVSGWTLVAISIERHYAICHPLTSRKWQTTRHARLVILIVWAISLAMMSPIAIFTQLQPIGHGRHKCREAWPDPSWEKIFTILLDVVLLILPLCIMAVMYGLIVRHLWKVDQGSQGEGMAMSNGPLRKNVPENSSPSTPASTTSVTVYSSRRNTRQMTQPSLRRCNAEHCLKTKRRVLKMLLVVVLDYFICWTPLYAVNTIYHFAPSVLLGLGHTGIPLVQLLAQASCCCNPITYCFMSSSFRRAFLRAFGCSKITSITPSSNAV